MDLTIHSKNSKYLAYAKDLSTRAKDYNIYAKDSNVHAKKLHTGAEASRIETFTQRVQSRGRPKFGFGFGAESWQMASFGVVDIDLRSTAEGLF